jgi:archaellum component FlaC
MKKELIMPLPLLLAPLPTALSYIVSSVAAATGYSGATVVGVGVGGAGVGGLGVWFLRGNSSSAPPLPEEHEARLQEQHQLIETRFDEGEMNRAAHTNTLDASLKKSTFSLEAEAKSSETLQKSSENLSSEREKLAKVCTTAASTAQSFANDLPVLEKASVAIHEGAGKTELEFLELKKEIMKMKKEAVSLLKTITEKDEENVRLRDTVQVLAEENGEVKKRLSHAQYSNRLFKEYTQSTINKDAPLTTNQSQANLPH